MSANKYTDSLVPVRFYRPYDANFFTIDNRPLTDINTNVNLVNNGVNQIAGTNQFLTLLDESPLVNTILVNISQNLSAGYILNVKIAHTNTSAVSIVTNGSLTGPATVVQMNDALLTGGELVAGNWYLLSFNGTTYNVIAGTAGVVSAGAATASGQAVTQQTLLNQPNVSINDLTCTSLGVANASTLSGTATVTDALANSSSDGVQAQQLVQGQAYSSSAFNWTNVNSNTPLNVGQTASYLVAGQVANVPLHISCGSNEIYEISLINFNGSADGYDIVLLPNDAGYASQFYVGGVEVSPDNQEASYYTASGTLQYGINCSTFSQNSSGSFQAGFYFDDLSGSAQTPYMRTMRVFTGSTSSQALAFNTSGGGIYQAANSGGIGMGTNLSVAVWDNTSTAYTSLGTVLISPDAEWQILVRRMA